MRNTHSFIRFEKGWTTNVPKTLECLKDRKSTRLNSSHYAAGYEDFHADAKEAFLDLDFDSFKLPLATESSVLQTSSEDVNVMDDANNEVTQGDPKTGGSAPGGSSK